MKNTIASDLKMALLEKNVCLVAVSKTQPVSRILELYKAGIIDFGENRVQEMLDKQPELPSDIKWHMIGTLQKNKVKYLAPFVHLIHSVDSEELLKIIDKEAGKNERVINILLQVKIAEEKSKEGMSMPKTEEIVVRLSEKLYPNVALKGFMGMATFTDDLLQIRREFSNLASFGKDMMSKHQLAFDTSALRTSAPILSMGMSGDYEVAIEEGANMVRIGSLLFGDRS